MCPICWTFALLSVLGFFSASISIWVESNIYVVFFIMGITSILFWMFVYNVVNNKCKKAGKECMCGTMKK